MKEKTLENVSLEELWQLFPVVLKPHQPIWKTQFLNEKAYLESILDESKIRWIEQIGSTAIPSISAKPCVDVLIECKDKVSFDSLLKTLKETGYIVMSQNAQRASLNKGYTPKGYANEVFHIHLRTFGDHDELYFRDYLIEHPKAAKVYEALKEDLAKQFKHHRDHYTNQKSTYVQRITSKAKTYYNHKYDRV